MGNNRTLRSLQNKNNCTDFSNNSFSINEMTSLNDDKCENVARVRESTNINEYLVTNYASCTCDINEVLKTATGNQGLTVKDGYGLSECNIDKDSNLRIGDVNRHYKSDLQLFPRPFLTTPSVIKGQYDLNTENNLYSPLLNNKHKQLNNVDQDRIYTPLVENLQKNIQSPNFLIEEYVDKKWVRGGVNTKQIVTDIEYLAKSQDNIAVKNQLLKQKAYLTN